MSFIVLPSRFPASLVQQAHVEWPVWQVQLVNFGAHGPDTALLLLAIAPL